MLKKIPVSIAAFVLSALVLSGCSNPFIEKSRQASGVERTDVPEGFGTVRVELARGAARTIMPLVDLSALFLEYRFARGDEAAEEKTPEGGVFTLEPGSYTLEVNAFVDSDRENLAARGSTDTAFVISAGLAAETVSVLLRPVASGEGAGSLEFSLEYPAGASVEALVLTRVAGEEEPIDLAAAGATSGEGPLTLSGTKDDIPVGYYLLRATLKNSAGVFTGRTEVVHIYQNLTAEASYVFAGDDFRSFRVTSAADSGPGTLRQALTDALAETGTPQHIQVTLPPGSVITLETVLPEITKSMTIEGNGVTLTRAASLTAGSRLQLLYNNASAAELTVRRVHFKNGLATHGGAIRSGGVLTLESCIFSGNGAVGTGLGGAIYSAKTLTVRGCTFYGNSASSNGGAVCFGGNTSDSLILTGNLFYRSHTEYRYPVVYCSAGIVSASYNVVDINFGTGGAQCGWLRGTGDTQASDLPVSPLSFKLLYGNAAAGKLPDPLPTGYPALDFYGNAINGGGAAGAVQESAAQGGAYYYLDLSANNNAAGTLATDPLPYEGNFYAPDTQVTITAEVNQGYSLEHWLVNDGAPIETESLTLDLSAHTRVQAVFNRVVTVNVFTDGPDAAATPGTLRHALTYAEAGDIIAFSGVEPGTTSIELQSALPPITTSIVIEGNGVTLTRAASWTTTDDTSQLLRIGDTDQRIEAATTIRRMRFKNGLARDYGGAIRSGGVLTLESCIFSGNGTGSTGRGGAIYSAKTLTVRGCTFYGNTTLNEGGAVYFATAGNLTLTGNIFYRNHTKYPNKYPVVYCNSNLVSASYNVVDIDIGSGNIQCGWNAGLGDRKASDLPVSPLSFRLLYGSGAGAMLPSDLPEGYPAVDFYGNAINSGGAAGAVQESSAKGSGYYYLELSVNDSLGGTVELNAPPDKDGLVEGSSIAITAYPNSDWNVSWLVNDVPDTESGATLNTLSGHTWVQAVFTWSMVVKLFTDGPGAETTPGTLRFALAKAQEGDCINFIGVTPGATTIELQDTLPSIKKNMTIEGNGVTLARSASWTRNEVLLISSTGVIIRRIHFKNFLTKNGGGGVIESRGEILTLESCIFSDNEDTSSFGGGAIFAMENLTIRGCTFYKNKAITAGAVCLFASLKTLTLTGNIFYENRASSQYPVVRANNGTVHSSYSYNVVDIALGTGSAQCGWTAGTGDKTTLDDGDGLTIEGDPFDTTTFVPVSGLGNFLPAGLTDFPATDFYGTTRTFPGAPGAVAAAPGS